MVFNLLRAFFIFAGFTVLSPSVSAVEKGNLPGFNTGASSFTDTSDIEDAIRVRVPLRFTAYEQVVIKSETSGRRMTAKALSPIKYNFKATLDRVNHFYLQDWHVETVPEAWDHSTRDWTVTVNFYKRYGQGQELEEAVGTMALKGRLDGSGKLFKLLAKDEKTFNSKQGFPQLKVEINSSVPAEKGNIARRETPAAL